MSIQPLLPSGYVSLAQSMQKSTSTNNASGSQLDPLSILTGSADGTSGTSGTSALDLLFGGSADPTSSDSLASFLGSSSDTASVFASFTDEAKAALLKAQEEASNQTATNGTAVAAASTNASTSTANDPLLQALAAMLSPSAQAQSASWL